MSVLFFFRRRLQGSRLYSWLRRWSTANDVARLPDRARARRTNIAQMPDRRRLTRIALGLPARICRADGSVVDVLCADANDHAFAVDTKVPFLIGEPVTLTIGQHQRGPTFFARVVWCDRGRVGFRCTASANELPTATNF